jgi:hypothetical protein
MKPIYILYLFALLLIGGCRKEEPVGQIPTDNIPPRNITNIEVENISGGAIIKYDLPTDEDLLYVKAEYETLPGKLVESRSSVYKNELTVQGYGNTNESKIKLFAVDRSGNRSEPVFVKIKPLTPSITNIFNSLKLSEDFGGVHLSWSNEDRAAISVHMLAKDSIGDMNNFETVYTSTASGDMAFRGFDTIPRMFGVYLRDHWDNFSDTLIGVLHPIFEEELDKSGFEEHWLPTDQKCDFGWQMYYAWNGKLGEPGFHTPMGTFPQTITIDLGVTAKLSRYKIWQRKGSTYAYNFGNPRLWEVWGSVDPADDGSFDGWFKLRDCESVKPSGLPLGQLSNEDIEAIDRGEEYVIPLNAPEVRYIRFKFLDSWSGTAWIHFVELSFFGQVK